MLDPVEERVGSAGVELASVCERAICNKLSRRRFLFSSSIAYTASEAFAWPVRVVYEHSVSVQPNE